MHFGTDKKLYIAVGENAKPSTAQDLTDYGGKLLRVNTDGSPAEAIRLSATRMIEQREFGPLV